MNKGVKLLPRPDFKLSVTISAVPFTTSIGGALQERALHQEARLQTQHLLALMLGINALSRVKAL